MVKKRKKKAVVKRKITRNKKSRKNYNVSGVREDSKQRKKYEHGGRIEAYTWGEV